MTQETSQAIDFERIDDLSKEEVGEFIAQQMMLTKANGEPKWSVGLLTLVKHGMKRWDDEVEIDPQTYEHELQAVYEEMREYQQKYEARLQDLQKENQRLRWDLEDARSSSPPS